MSPPGWLGFVISRVRNREPVSDERAQGGQDLACPVVEVACLDGRRELIFVGITQQVGRRAIIEKFAFYGAQYVRGDPGVERHLPGVGGPTIRPESVPYLVVQEVGDRSDQFGGGRPPIQP